MLIAIGALETEDGLVELTQGLVDVSQIEIALGIVGVFAEIFLVSVSALGEHLGLLIALALVPENFPIIKAGVFLDDDLIALRSG